MKKIIHIIKLVVIALVAILSLPLFICGMVCWAIINVFLLPVTTVVMVFCAVSFLGLPIEYAYVPSMVLGYIVSFKPLTERFNIKSLKLSLINHK